eukprot:jgi/Chlat1/7020/Chrsp56S06695
MDRCHETLQGWSQTALRRAAALAGAVQLAGAAGIGRILVLEPPVPHRKQPQQRRGHAQSRQPLFASLSASAEEAKAVLLGNGRRRRRGGSDGSVGIQHVSNPKADKDNEERMLVSDIQVAVEGAEVDPREGLEGVVRKVINCKPNFSFTLGEIQDDVNRIFKTGYFGRCTPKAENTRDGIRLTFLVQPNPILKGVMVNGGSVLPARVIEEAFKTEYGKRLNFTRISRSVDKLNDWYKKQGYVGQVIREELMPGGIVRLDTAEAVVNKINVQFLDSKTGEPTEGETKLHVITRQLATKPGHVYNLKRAKRDLEAIYSMGIMEDVNILPYNSSEPGKIDLTLNVMERKRGLGLSAGGGLSANDLVRGALKGIYGSMKYSHNNLFGLNQKLLVAIEKGQLDSAYKVNYTDPWVEGDAYRTSRSMYIQNTQRPGTTVHSFTNANSIDKALKVHRAMAAIEYSRAIAPEWTGVLGLQVQRACMKDETGQLRTHDQYGGPLAHSSSGVDKYALVRAEAQYRSNRGTQSLMLSSEVAVPVARDWLCFTRFNGKGVRVINLGPLTCNLSGQGGLVMGDLPPHEAFPIGGVNSVRGYDEGAVGSGRMYAVGSGEVVVPLVSPVDATVFVDYGTDLRSGPTVAGDPAGIRGKPGTGYGYGAGVRLASPLGPLRLEYAVNGVGARRFHFGIGSRT